MTTFPPDPGHEWSLTGLSGRATRMFRLIGVHPGPDATVAAAASLAGLPRNEARLALLELCGEHLITEHAPGRYTRHDHLRLHAAEMPRAEDGDTAVHRLLDHYLHTASVASGLLYPHVMQFAPGRPRRGVRPEKFCHTGEAEEWFSNERHVLLAAIDRAADEGYRPYAWALPWVAGPFFRDKGARRRLAAAQMSALRVAAEYGDMAGRALANLHLGQLGFWLGEHADACRHLEDAIALYRTQGNQDGAAFALNTLGRELAQLGMLP